MGPWPSEILHHQFSLWPLRERSPQRKANVFLPGWGWGAGGVSPLDVGVVHAAVVQVVAEGSDQQREHLQVRQLALPGRTRRRGREERMVW